jgi:hypothetical protein
LPPVQDAFCQECGNALDEAPFRSDTDTLSERDTGSAMIGAVAQRPPGITLLAVLHVIGGILLAVLQFALIAKLDEMEEPLRVVGLSPVLLVIGSAFLALIGIGAAVGMWLGRKWGWWLGAFYYVYGVARNASALLTLGALDHDLESSARGPEYYYFKHVGRIIVHLLILLYFFKGNVMAYFGLSELSKWKAVSIMVAASIAIWGAVSIINQLNP